MMTYTRRKYRLGTTATAAVLALSSTQLLAQEAPSAETPAADAPSEATVTPAPATDEPAPAADPPVPTAESATSAASTEASAMPAETKVASTRSKSAVKTAQTAEHSATRSAEPVGEAPKPAVEPSGVSDPSPLDSMEPAEIASVPDAKPVERAKLDEAVPLAGGAGAVLLALAGAGMAVRRRKLRQDEDGFEQDWRAETVIADKPVAGPELLWDPPVREPAAMTPARIAEANEVSEDFDTSKFGPHVQAAYRGPTSDNPSLSLRKRLKIAGELDRRERESGQIADAGGPAPAATAGEPAVAAAKAPHSLSFSYSGTPAQVKWAEKQY
jgi:resuscitation-promoting factor RpfA